MHLELLMNAALVDTAKTGALPAAIWREMPEAQGIWKEGEKGKTKEASFSLFFSTRGREIVLGAQIRKRFAGRENFLLHRRR